jgi:hypothetical protein
MKKIKQFKSIIHVLYILLIIYVAIIAFAPVFVALGLDFSILSNHAMESHEYWIFFSLYFLVYLLFLLGVYYLRKVSLLLQITEPFQEPVIDGLNKSGSFMILAGFLSISSSFFAWVFKLFSGEFSIGYGSDLILTLLIIIIGLFFKIQSKTLAMANENKRELDLVV